MKLVTPKIKAALVVLFLAGVLGLLWFEYSHFLERGKKPPAEAVLLNKLENEGVPDFTIKDLQGTDIKLSQFQGKLVVLNFWASWCDPCVAEFPSLIALLNKFKGRVVLIAVSADYEETDIRTFLKALKLEHPQLYVAWDKDLSLAKQFGTFKLPESYIIGKRGQLIRKVAGVDDWSSEAAFSFFTELDQQEE